MRAYRSARSAVAVVAGTGGLLVGAFAAPAFAAGGGYGVVPPVVYVPPPAPVVPPTSVPPPQPVPVVPKGPISPPGFTGAVCAKTFNTVGGHIECTYFKVAHLDLLVPKDQFTQSYQVVFTPGHAPTVSKYLLNLTGDTSTLSFGILFEHQSTPVSLSHSVALLITDPQVKKGDIITEYENGHFVEIGVVHHNGILVLDVKGEEEFAVVSGPTS